MMFFVVVAFIKPVLYMENRLIQYNISRNVSFNILSLNDWLVNISYEINTTLLRIYYNQFNPFATFMN